MSSTGIRKMLEAIAMKANRSTEGQKMMKEWVGQYDGKIIQFEADADKFYAAVSKERMKILSGEYPAPDLTIRGKAETLLEVFTGRRRFGDAMKSWDVVLIGAGHEAFHAGRLIAQVIMEA